MGRARHLAGVAYRRVRPKPIPDVLPTVGRPKRTYPEYEIGEHCYGDIRVIRDVEEHTLKVGDYCSFGEDTTFWVGGGHRTEWVTTYPFNVLQSEFSAIKGHPVSRGDTIVGSDVWTGFQVVVMSGVSIGHGAVVGTRSVVTRDVEPYSIVAGAPARKIGQRFDDATIAQLLKIAWWDWDETSVRAAVPFLQSAEIEAFITEVREGRLPLS